MTKEENDQKNRQPDKVREESVYYAETGKKQGEYTIEDYYALPDDVRAELIDGEIYDMSAPQVAHQVLLGSLFNRLSEFIKRKGRQCLPLIAPVDVQLDMDDKTMVQPDILVLCNRDKLKKRVIHGAPDMIIEILSKSSWKKDTFFKLGKYLDAGVREYWMVDPDRKKVVVYDFEHSPTTVIYGFEEQVPVRIFGGECVIDFAEIYREIEFLYEMDE